MDISPALAVPGLILIAAGICDLRRRQIPHGYALALLVWAFVSRALGYQDPSWMPPVAGLAVGVGVGMVFFGVGVFGAGDAKLIAGLGAVLGPVGLALVLIWVAAIGGTFALLAQLRGRRSVVYGPAIAIGYVIAVAIA